MNLEKLNLVELNAQEVKDVDGGLIPILIPFAVAYWAGGLSIAASAITVAAYLGYKNNK
jgi:lactobin A/cerein 7B family class IIb bacteriocin